MQRIQKQFSTEYQKASKITLVLLYFGLWSVSKTYILN